MAKQELTIVMIETDPELTLEQLCQSCHVTPEFVQELIHYGVIEATVNHHFDVRQLQRLRRLQRLQRDLELNLAGAALAVDLLEQLDEMRRTVMLLNYASHRKIDR